MYNGPRIIYPFQVGGDPSSLNSGPVWIRGFRPFYDVSDIPLSDTLVIGRSHTGGVPRSSTKWCPINGSLLDPPHYPSKSE